MHSSNSLVCTPSWTLLLTNNSNTDVKQSNVMATIVAVTMALSPECAPLALFTADRLKLPVTGYPPNNPELKLAIPNPTSSKLASSSYPWTCANFLAMAMLSMNPTITILSTTIAIFPDKGKMAFPVKEGRPGGMYPTMGIPRDSKSIVAWRTMHMTVTNNGPPARVHLKRGYLAANFFSPNNVATHDVPRRNVFQLNCSMFAKMFFRMPCNVLSLGTE